MQTAYKIVANGSNITDLIADRLLSAQITDSAGVKMDRLTLIVDDRDQRLEAPKTGAKIEVSLGYVGKTLTRMGTFVVSEVEFTGPAREMVISAHAVDMGKGLKAPKERSFDGITLGNLARTIAGDNALQPVIAPSLESRDLGHVDQTESDMQLLQRICSEQGATCKITDTKLVVAERASGKTATGKTMEAVDIVPGDCQQWSAILADRNKYKSVTAYYQHLGNARRTGVTAGSGKPVLHLKNSYPSREDAKQAAESKLKAVNGGAASVRISGLIGDPTMCAERIVNLKGFRQGVDGDGWVINSVSHNFSNNGYTCELDIEGKA